MLVLFLLDRLALWMERRGWIYWRHEKSSANTLGNAFLEVHSIFEPEKEIILEARQQETLEETESGDPPRSSADEERTE